MIPLEAKEASWYQKLHPIVEAGMHLSSFEGSIKDLRQTADIKKDLAYGQNNSSYFSLGLQTDYPYMFNILWDYFDHKQSQTSTLNKTIYIADGQFETNSTVITYIHYTVSNLTFLYDFYYKGNRVKFLRWRFYPGDLAYYVGLNVKYLYWRIDANKVPQERKHWVIVKEFIPLPYLGVQYFYRYLRIYAHISALSLNEAKSTNYEVGFAYRAYRNFYLKASYLYEDFQATESAGGHVDIVKFATSGTKFSFQYTF
ncbi:hypothetical protein MNB_SM-3-874 [hydrothermal vent metagenome]|uniref:Uncharacterized protein n=1 Tax=hydrothermal vent metagenome TaxID=652676 RepID=A0A1W1D5Q6_9ZZZZ